MTIREMPKRFREVIYVVLGVLLISVFAGSAVYILSDTAAPTAQQEALSLFLWLLAFPGSVVWLSGLIFLLGLGNDRVTH